MDGNNKASGIFCPSLILGVDVQAIIRRRLDRINNPSKETERRERVAENVRNYLTTGDKGVK